MYDHPLFPYRLTSVKLRIWETEIPVAFQLRPKETRHNRKQKTMNGMAMPGGYCAGDFLPTSAERMNFIVWSTTKSS